ncbi:uncharacterized protein LOC123550299 [Mercenaria mercenaria]|uniref:uncharacterized protein LOC123550299 n=1 Tax=Mercenaria mercenaria TaxID=6596 RepID=UPI00234EB79B|nr:uncharacterized protein LOC123550299 [Mercenaria mercenaria]
MFKTEVALLKNKTTDLESKVAALKGNDAVSQNKITALESELTALKAAKPSIGVSYVRWGRITCPGNGTEFIYKGYMAGADYTETGGGANHLCLPEDPTWSKYVDGYNNGAEKYGTEIELVDHVSSTIFGKQTNNQDIPCAVCRSIRSSYVMVPARANCYPGWTQEYGGYIVAAYPSRHKADYICLDAY